MKHNYYKQRGGKLHSPFAAFDTVILVIFHHMTTCIHATEVL